MFWEDISKHHSQEIILQVLLLLIVYVVASSAVEGADVVVADLPENVDWREAGVMTDPKNQVLKGLYSDKTYRDK